MDALLASLQFGDDGVFNLSRNLISISVRDQMVRASMLARGLAVWIRERFEDSNPPLPVLIAGAGAAGMTVAALLAKQQIPVEVVEAAKRPFDVQRGCLSRWLDLVQYDWPMDHWDLEVFPWHIDPDHALDVIPFPCPAAKAADLVADSWDRKYESYRSGPTGQFITMHFGRKLHRYPLAEPGENYLNAYLAERDGSVPYQGRYSAVVIAYGHGQEDMKVGHECEFVGHRFWDTDDFEDPTYGERIKPKQDKVIISGTGDGGLQDFLRLMTRTASARELLIALGLSKSNLVRLDVIHSHENRLERASTWSNPRGSAYPFTNQRYMKDRFDGYLEEVDRILTPDLQCRVIEAVAKRPRMTYLLSREHHFTCFYGLNLFLALLIIRAVMRHPDPAVSETLKLEYGKPVQRIELANPGSVGPKATARGCVTADWNVWLEDADEPIQANVIVLRHGLMREFDEAPRGVPADNRPRPLPPTHLYPEAL